VTGRTTAVQYTLTSPADHTRAPTGWRLMASADGRHWTTLDRRTSETFTWDRQTRAFSIPHPSSYAHYHLDLDRESTLAEVELLASPTR